MRADANDSVRVRTQFLRSVRLDADFDRPDALASYIMQPSPRAALETVARHVNETQQRAFTWTGPYGGGKSSLALALACLCGGNASARKAARAALKVTPDDEIGKAFGGRKPWLVLPVVGRRESAEDAIGSVIDKHAPLSGRKPHRNGKRDVIAELLRRAEQPEYSGVLLILDEMGKMLEAAAAAGDDIFFYQELAESAARSGGRLLVIGVLHQAFEQYAARLGREVREEWAKVQGRYLDIPVVAGTDEVIQLIGGALESAIDHPRSAKVAKNVAAVIHRRRPSSPANLAEALDLCWPLHPVAAALLGPSSRRRFGQNERSVFGFLSSAEPLGFRDFLQGRSADSRDFYLPARYWDYLRANLEQAILSSPDGHRWAVSVEAVERAEARFGEPHLSLVKTTGLIELFRNGSGLAAETEVLVECVDGATRKELDDALEDLARASVLIYRKHLHAWGIFAGSDFDIDAAVAAARAAIGAASQAQISALANLPPITARRHYSETGTLRWFDREVMAAEFAREGYANLSARRGGRFVLLLTSSEFSEQRSMRLAMDLSKEGTDELTLFGVPRKLSSLLESAAELAALEHVSRTRLELEGDAVAKREVDARLRQLRSDLEAALRDAFLSARWYWRGERHDVESSAGLSPLASTVCDHVFRDAPRIQSELVNRDSLSSNAAAAQRALLHRMISHGDRPLLDFEGFPAEAGLYFTVIAELGIHRARDGQAAFVAPQASDKKTAAPSLIAIWHKTAEILAATSGAVTLAQIYAEWRKPPYGVKHGVMPILALAYVLAHRSELALYVEGVFVPELTDSGIDEWLQDPNRVSLKAVRMDTAAKRLLSALSQRLQEALKKPVAADPLDSARALVSLTISLPAWTQRTSQLSERARSVRSVLLRASDPVKVIFADLPEVLGTHKAEELVEAIGTIVTEFNAAYPRALRAVQDQLLKSIDHSGDFAKLRERADAVQGAAGDLKLDAFAGRLKTFNGAASDVEGLVSLAVSKPPKDFNDYDLDSAALQLAKWAFEFRRVEALAPTRGKGGTRRAFAVVFGSGGTVSGTFDVAEADSPRVKSLADGMLDRLISGEVTPDVLLAALAEAGARVLESKKMEKA